MNATQKLEIANIRYIDGMKQDKKGDYYYVDICDDRGNVIREEKQYMTEAQEATITINLKSQGDNGGHIWHVAKYGRITKDCMSQQCNICNKYHSVGRAITANLAASLS